MTAPADLRLGAHATLSGDIRTLDITDGDALLPDGEVLVTPHVKNLPDVPSVSSEHLTYARVYLEAMGMEAARPLSNRTRAVHDVAAGAVAVYAVLDLAKELDDAGLDEAAAFARTHAEHLPDYSPIATRHNAAQHAAHTMSPAYAAWVQRNSPNVTHRLVDLIGTDAAVQLLAEFNISPKADR